jgi:hypothetical protein
MDPHSSNKEFNLRVGTRLVCTNVHVHSPRNENFNLLVQMKFLNLFYIVLNKNWKIYWFEQSFTGLGTEDRCSFLAVPWLVVDLIIEENLDS